MKPDFRYKAFTLFWVSIILTNILLFCELFGDGGVQDLNYVVSSNVNSMEVVLQRSNRNGVVILSVVSGNYKNMLMNFACNMQLLGITNHIVAALDEEMYEFALSRNMNVFRPTFLNSSESSNTRCSYGTECFKKMTKMKSRIVLQVLYFGYKVLFSDVDIIWFKDITEDLTILNPNEFHIQSEQPVLKQPGNQLLNSGLYFANPSDQIIEGFERIVDHALQSELSEQPSFNQVLCGKTPEHGRKKVPFGVSTTECIIEDIPLITRTLPLDEYPNGKVGGYWDLMPKSESNSSKSLSTPFSKMKILHNNWIKGAEAKINRFKDKGFWFIDDHDQDIRCISYQ